MNLSNNTILITGGTSGIGLAFAEEFLKLGNSVIITGRRQDRLEAIKDRLPEIITKVSDLAQEAQRVELAKWIIENHPKTNVLINNAGIQLVTDLKKVVDVERLQSEVETNFIAPVHFSSLLTEHLSKVKNPAIINITSGLAYAPIAFLAVYCATKAAMHSITLSLRHSLKDTGIAVFEIAPPSTDTELGHDRREDKTESHGGIPVHEFIEGAMNALKNDVYEAAIGLSADIRNEPETFFTRMNSM